MPIWLHHKIFQPENLQSPEQDSKRWEDILLALLGLFTLLGERLLSSYKERHLTIVYRYSAALLGSLDRISQVLLILPKIIHNYY